MCALSAENLNQTSAKLQTRTTARILWILSALRSPDLLLSLILHISSWVCARSFPADLMTATHGQSTPATLRQKQPVLFTQTLRKDSSRLKCIQSMI